MTTAPSLPERSPPYLPPGTLCAFLGEGTKRRELELGSIVTHDPLNGFATVYRVDLAPGESLPPRFPNGRAAHGAPFDCIRVLTCDLLPIA